MKNKILIIISLFTSSAFAGGGWVAKKGNGYVKLGQSAIYADQLFNKGGSRSDITTTGVYISELYGELGLGKSFEAMVRLPFFFRTTINEVQYRSGGVAIEGDEFNFPGDPSLGLKYGLITDNPVVLSASIRLDFPLGKTDGGNSDLIQTGDGEFNQLLKIESGYSSKSSKFYASVGVGFNNRTNNFSDEFHFNAECGYYLAKKILLISKIYGIESFQNGEVSGNNSGIFSNNMEQLLITPQLVVELKNGFGIELASSLPLSGRNILASPIHQAGIFYKIRK